ncbi:MAG: MFS transporter [Ignavibacteria bacterium]|nr:MFS transporter [Ignavibacteria bacterium]
MKKVRGLRWYIIVLIAIATIINYIDRNALAIMWPNIAADLELSKEQYATIVSFFMVAYAIGQSLSGKVIDAIGTRMGFTLTIIVWSISCMLHAAARGLASFGLFRALLGVSEAGNWPGATKSNAEWFPIKERALAQGIFNAGASMGAVVSAPLIAFLYLLVGWKATFIIVGALGIIWVIPWLYVNKALPKDHPWLSDEEREYILSGQRVEAKPMPETEERVPTWGELLTYRQSWSVIVSRFFFDPIWWMFITWLPIYLFEVFGFDIKQIGLFAWVPYVGAAIGSLIGGWFSGYLIGRGKSTNVARKLSITLGGVIAFPALIFSAYASTPLLAVLAIAVVLFGFQFSIQNIQTLPSDFFSGKSVGSLAGMGGTSAVAGVLIMIWLVPVITKVSYVPFFLMGAILVPLGILAVFVFGGEIKRVELNK